MEDQFKFLQKYKTVLFAGMGIGVLCLILTWFSGDDGLHTRFWTNYLHNTVFFTGLGFIGAFVLMAFILAYAGWYVTFKRLWEAFSQFLIVGVLMMIPIVAGVWGHFHHIYHWADPASVASDELLQSKSGFLNPVWYTISVLFVVVWYLFVRRFRALSLEEDQHGTTEYAYHTKQKKIAGAFLLIAAFSSAAVIWQWIMSIDAHWYSTLFAWYTTASWFVATMALTVMVMIFLKAQGYFEHVTKEHFHDLGKFVFAFSIFWTYLWFSQFMLIWYANVGEETVYFQTRMKEYPILYYGNLIINFVLPFFILMRNDTKRKYGTLFFASLIVFIGHWFDFFQMIKPGAMHTAHEVAGHGAHGEEGGHGAHEAAGHGADHASSMLAGFDYPGLLEFGIFIGFLSLFLFVVFHHLSKAALTPKNDPYLGESMHHEVWDDRIME